jgi:putative sterol carrier protein
MTQFPADDWLPTLKEKLNTDEQYADIARNWEGDMICKIEPDGPLPEAVIYYLDLWHGKCRDAYILEEIGQKNPALLLTASYSNFIKILKGETEVVQALLTRKISVKGNMALLMRNVPTVLDFVRCCREITNSYL